MKKLLTQYSGAMHDLAQLLIDQDEVDGQDVEDLVTRYDEMIAAGDEPKALPEPPVLVTAGVAPPEPYVFGSDDSSNGANGRNGST